MGPSDSNTTSTQEAAYPPEFRPLAKSAVDQIQQLQKNLPLAMFSGYQPAGTAGLSPLQSFAIDEMLPATMRPTAGLQGEAQTPGAVGAAALGTTAAGNATGAENAALASLSNRLGRDPGRLPSSTPYQWGMAAQMPGNVNPAVFPGMSEATIQSLHGISGGQVPVLGGPGVSHVNPTQPGTFPDPYAGLRPPVDLQSSIWRMQLNPAQQKLFDQYLKAGMNTQEAFAKAMNAPPPAAPVPQAPPPVQGQVPEYGWGVG